MTTITRQGVAKDGQDANDAAWRARYAEAPVVNSYRELETLQVPEQAIFQRLRSTLAMSSLLDVGVGAGRTAAQLGGTVAEYTGVDYSARMIEACHKRFSAAPWYSPNRFQVEDARALSFGNSQFDIVFFSFNGLDHVSPAQRDVALAECHRVLRPGGWFIYSGHNLSWYDGKGLLPRSRGWREWMGQYRYLKAMKTLNGGQPDLRAVDEATLRDAPHGLLLHYARPTAHLRETQRAGFVQTRVFNRQGREVTGHSRLNGQRDTWMYYLSRRPTLQS